MNDMVEKLAAELRQMLDGIAVESGVTMVAVRGDAIRRRYGMSGVVVAKGMRAAGFWLNEDGLWRAVAGAKFLHLDFETVEEGAALVVGDCGTGGGR